MVTTGEIEKTAYTSINWDKIRDDFPILKREVNGKPLVYLDNAASSQKPQEVIDAIDHYYAYYNANVHRGVHTLSQEGTNAFEASRNTVKDFINAGKIEEVIFTKGTTGSINLLAYSWGRKFIQAGDEILISAMEHHSNIVPWQILCEEKKAALKVIPINEKGELIWEEFIKLLTDKTKLLSVVHISNALGTINPVEEMIAEAHKKKVVVHIDGAQAAPHVKIDVQKLDCDFYSFSGHKMCAPTGIGILYGKEKWLNEMPPFEGGGEMIKTVSFTKTTYNELPFKFEAGTPNIEGSIVLADAIRYLNKIGLENIARRENELLEKATQALSQIEGIRFIGTAEKKSSVISFLVGNIHPYDMGMILDKMGIAVRTGNHCTQPLMDIFGVPGTVRASFSFYNNENDIERLVEGVKKAVKMLG
jgi:cysteine desulfurase/selenocysteine lyase